MKGTTPLKIREDLIKELEKENAELLQACKLLLKRVKEYGFGEPNSATNCLEAILKAEETIAKAEGK